MGNKITKEKLGSKIWDAANQLRDKLEPHEYKDYVLGLVFYKFLCEKQTNYLIKTEFPVISLNILIANI